MNKNSWLILGAVLIVVLLLILWPKGKGADENAARNALPQAQVTVLAPTVKVGNRTLVSGEKVKAGEVITTDGSGRAEIKLSDGSIVRLGSNGELRIEELTLDNKKTAFRLVLGRLFVRVQQLSDRESFQVQTATTVATVRGTSLGLFKLAGKFDKILALKNETEVRKMSEEKVLKLRQGRQVIVDPAKPLKDGPISLTSEEKKWLQWNLERELVLGVSYDSAITVLPSADTDTGAPTGSSSSTSSNLNQPSSGVPWGEGPSQ